MRNRSQLASGPRWTSNPAFRSTAFRNRTRFSGNRTTAFNAANYTGTNPRLTAANRTRGVDRTQGFDRTRSFDRSQNFNRRQGANRTQGFNPNRERVVARHSANWRRHWDRNRDHWWRGRRCHFHNNVWVIYEPLFWYPASYRYSYYPYDSYYNSGYYEDAYATDQYAQDQYAADQYAPPAYTDQAVDESGSQARDVQRALAREGYYDGPIDGQLGAGTRKALRRYQSDRGLDVTGGINQSVIESLRLR